ncbi:unnamed protein product [Schistosoma curassoni]|uniref:TFIIIC_sub6 domain-containing protein n=1 Tax=Schistosoma curassoni TaxID=6186 RepID=A0A183K9S6_9TREM|nr:unnamed protein product [Schistosoma curassoni]
MTLDDLDFSDDLALLSHTQQQMQVKITSVEEASASIGPNIHKGKSKILKFNTKNTNTIILDGEALEEVETYTYLDIVTDKQGGSDANVKLFKRASQRAAFRGLKTVKRTEMAPTETDLDDRFSELSSDMIRRNNNNSNNNN